MRQGDCFCVLGVMCEVWRRHTNHKNVEWLAVDAEEINNPADVVYAFGRAQYYLSLPEKIAEWFGLENCNPEVVVGGEHYAISELNDVDGFDFQSFADMLTNQ